MKLDSYLTLYTNTNSNRDLNIKPKTIEVLEEDIGAKFLYISLGNDFFGFDISSKDNKSKNR